MGRGDRWRRWRLICALVAAGASALPAVSGQVQHRFRALRVHGPVTVLAPHQLLWRPLPLGSDLPPDSLVRVAPGGYLLLEHAVGRQGLTERENFEFRAAAVLRLSPEVLRHYETAQYHFHRSPFDGEIDFLSMLGKQFLLDLRDAWAPVAAIFTASNEVLHHPQALAYYERVRENPIALTRRLAPIVLTRPVEGTVYSAPFLPFRMALHWEPVAAAQPSADGDRYAVYLWPLGKARPQRSYRTRADQMIVQIPQPGAYLLQVETVDGRASSAATGFFVSTAGSTAADALLLAPVAPGDHSLFFTDSEAGTADIEFVWQVPSDVFSRHPVDFTLWRRGQRPPLLARTLQGAGGVQASLPPADYTWQIQLRDRATAAVLETSPRRHLTVASGPSDPAARLRLAATGASSHQVVWLLPLPP